MFHIDAHGPDHGLSVEIDLSSHTVTIREWAECCEPDENGSYSPHIQTATIELADLFTGPHVDCGHVSRESMHGRIASLAINWLSHWGGEDEPCDDDERPCDYFGSFWGKHKANPEHLKCSACGATPD